MPSPVASDISSSAASGSQPNLRDKSQTASGLLNEIRIKSSARWRTCTNFRSSSSLSTTKMRASHHIDFPVARQVEVGALREQRSDDRLVRQWLQCVM